MQIHAALAFLRLVRRDKNGVAEKIVVGFRHQGVAALVLSVLRSPTQAEANYVSRRVYPMVPGYLGRFATVDIALETARARFRLDEEGELLAEVVPPEWSSEATACGVAIARPRVGDVALAPATGKSEPEACRGSEAREPRGAACAGPASCEPSQFRG